MAQEIVRADDVRKVQGYELTIQPLSGRPVTELINQARSAEERVDLDIALFNALDRMQRRMRLRESFTLWINVFPSTLLSHSAMAIIRQRIACTAHRIVIEITEHEFQDDYRGLAASIRSLQDAGAKVVIDDFGSGAASMRTLLELPVDGIKIDREVFQKAVHDMRYIPLIEGTIAAADNLNLPVVIEGVETENHLAVAKRLGARLVQGFLINYPMAIPATTSSVEFSAMLADRYKRQATRVRLNTAVTADPRNGNLSAQY